MKIEQSLWPTPATNASVLPSPDESPISRILRIEWSEETISRMLEKSGVSRTSGAMMSFKLGPAAGGQARPESLAMTFLGVRVTVRTTSRRIDSQGLRCSFTTAPSISPTRDATEPGVRTHDGVPALALNGSIGGASRTS